MLRLRRLRRRRRPSRPSLPPSPDRPRRLLLAVLAVTAGLCAAAEPADAADRAVPGDTLVTGSIGDAHTLLPILASDASSGEICGLVYNGLVKYDKQLQVVGDLAESWEILDEGLTIIFHLRQGVRWHDGAPFTAKDVQFTYERLIDPNVRTPYSGDFERVASLQLLDDYTVKVTYKEPFAPGLISWGMGIMPAHLLRGHDLQTSPLARRPVGTGPYRFHSWKTGERIVLVANPDYFEHRPYLDRYYYRVIPDQATMFLELSTQQLDETGLTPLQYARQTGTPAFHAHFQKFRYPSFGFTYLGYNLSDSKFSDRRVRQAINAAIDKTEIVRGVLLGLGKVATGPYPQESWAYNPEVPAVPYDPAAARRLLAEAGWRDTNGDGVLDRHGRAFAFTVLTNQGNETRQHTAEIIQRRLSEVGIRMQIRVIEWSTFVSEFIDKRRFEAVLLGWSLSRDPDLYDIFHSSKTGEGEFNFVGYASPEIDRLLLEGRRTFNEGRRRVIYHEIHRILAEDQPYTFLFVPDALPIVHRRVRGIEASPIGIGYNFIDWYVPEGQQRYKAKLSP
ncbi:MAG: peptide-binding protein [Candidatus Omnitrophica bacterium]|nr:peptide-binding protein [Candidatus Omnitrophota bacterium]